MAKKLLSALTILSFFFATNTTLLAQDSWQQKASFGGTARMGGVGFAVLGKGYIGTGYDGTVDYNDLWQYDPINNSWAQMASMPGSGRVYAAGFAIGTKGYIGTGYDLVGSTYLSDLYEYNPTTNTWASKAGLPGGAADARAYAVGMSISGKGYLGTGWSGAYRNDFFEYNAGTDTWTAKANFPGTSRYGAAAFSTSGKGYLGTGYDGGYPTDFYEYNPTGDTWTSKAAFPGTGREGAAAFGIAGKGYITTGINGSNFSDSWQYDPISDSWTAAASYGAGGTSYASAFTIKGRGYVGAGNITTDFWQYRPVFNYSYVANPDTGCSPMMVNFTSMSNDPQVRFIQWSFGNNNLYDTLVSVSNNYSWSGSFFNDANFYDAGSNWLGYFSGPQIFVQQGHNGNFYMSPNADSICPNTNVYFDPNGNSGFVKWNMSDGYNNTNQYINRTFTALGTYTINCVLNTACGTDTISKVLVVSNSVMPNSAFGSNPATVCPNEPFNFNPNAYDGVHLWNFGDGATSSYQSVSHSYTVSGTYTVTHTLTNSCGNQTVTTNTVTVSDTLFPSNAFFNYNPSSPLCPGVQINFNSNNYQGTWSWDFGDGNTASSQNPKHTFFTPGNYYVVHSITNSCGNTTSDSILFVIADTLAPDPNFSHYPNPACPNDLIGFNPYENYGKTYFWNFGDGFTSSLKNPQHKYTTAGNYLATLTVTNFCDSALSYSDTVRVENSLPISVNGTMNANPQIACPNQPVNIDVNAYGFPIYIFDFGDGVVDTFPNQYVQHTYSVAGTYTASVTIANNCGSDTTLYKIITINNYVPFPQTPLTAGPSVLCPGQNMNVNAPWGFPSYQWDMGNSTAPFTTANNYISYSYTATGTYVISCLVTDYCGNDTTISDTVTVGNSPYFCAQSPCSLNVNSSSPVCPNQTAYFNSDYGYAQYEWFFGDGSSTITSVANTAHSYTAAGVYNYSLTVTNFCGVDSTVFGSINVDINVPLPGWINLYAYPDVVCPGQEVQFNTDNNYNSYYWNFGDGYAANGTGNVTHTYTASGVYTASVTITNYCGNSTTVTYNVTVDTGATFPTWMSMWYNPDPSCPGSAVTLETTAGYASYFWDFGDGDTITTYTSKVMHVYTAAGSYAASVLVTNTCGNTVTVNKSVSISNSVNVGSIYINTPNNPACIGDVVMINVSSGAGGGGGGQSLTYVWDYGDGSPLDTTIGSTSHTYTANGSYNVVVTATNTCGNSSTSSQVVTINSNANPQLNQWSFGILNEYNQPVNAVCPGDVLVFYFEGVNPNNLWDFGDGYTGVATDVFVRTDGVTVTTIKHAYTTLGTYNYSLTLGNNCSNNASLSKSISVTGNMLINGGFMIEPPTSSIGYTTCGQIDFVAFGGNNFVWDFGDGSTLSTLSPTVGHSYVNSGNYTVKVTITNGCGNTATYIKTLIINGVGGTSVNSSTASPTCYGGNDGSATASVTGGEAPYSYVWYDNIGQPISTAVSASGLSAGNYVVTVTDNNGCEGSSSVTLSNPAAITFSVSSTQSSCGGASGTASASSIAGGSSPYTYLWSDGQTAATATGLSLGNYGITISDMNGCSSTNNASVSENGATLSVSSVTNATCNGNSDGAANINATGGTPPYTYAWSNGATTQNISGVTAGSYSVVVTDAGNCQSTINAVVSEPNAIVVNVTPAVSPTCGNFDGSALANVSGGSAPYSYLWPTAANQTTQTATGLPAGTYSVTVTDGTGCTKIGSITLSNSNAPNVTATVIDVDCNGNGNGTIDITVTGGTSPYLYTWNVGPPQTNNQDLNTLAPGIYFVAIQDAAGCVSNRLYTIAEPSVLSATASSTPATCGNNNGTALATPAGGNTPYAYLWTGGSVSQSPTGLALGNYTVSVTDNKGCTTSATTTITATTLPIEICMVTVDSLTSTKNEIVWEKTPANSNTDSVRIYRLAGINYVLVGTVDYDSLSRFVDNTMGVDPNIQSYKYKLETVDTCGGVSAMSNHHKTMHNTANIGVGGVVNLIWDQYEGFASAYYRIWRDSTGMNPQLIDSTIWGNLTYTDLNPPTLTDTVSYRIEVVTPSGCAASIKNITTMASNFNSSKSNVFRVWDTTLTSVVNPFIGSEIVIYPNPNNGSFTVSTGKTQIVKMQILDMLGREVISSTTISSGKYAVNIPYSQGVYVLKVVTPNGIINKKFIIE